MDARATGFRGYDSVFALQVNRVLIVCFPGSHDDHFLKQLPGHGESGPRWSIARPMIVVKGAVNSTTRGLGFEPFDVGCKMLSLVRRNSTQRLRRLTLCSIALQVHQDIPSRDRSGIIPPCYSPRTCRHGHHRGKRPSGTIPRNATIRHRPRILRNCSCTKPRPLDQLGHTFEICHHPAEHASMALDSPYIGDPIERRIACRSRRKVDLHQGLLDSQPDDLRHATATAGITTRSTRGRDTQDL